MEDLTIDPQLRLQPPPTQPPREPSSLSTISYRQGDTPDAQSETEQNDGGTSRKRQKLNLYKCNQCRVARKKVSSHFHLNLLSFANERKVFSNRSRLAREMSTM